MIETLSNLKNNKVKKTIGGGADGTGAQEAVERLKRFLSGMNKKRHGKRTSYPGPEREHLTVSA
jgi:nucleolar MIF4G domain-containing protein 1